MEQPLRPEKIEHPATPEAFKNTSAIWQAAFEQGWLGNRRVPFIAAEFDKCSIDGYAKGETFRKSHDMAHPAEDEITA